MTDSSVSFCAFFMASGVLMGAALAKAVAPREYFDCPGSMLVPWLLVVNWNQLSSHVQALAALAVCGTFVGYNFMRHSRFCE